MPCCGRLSRLLVLPVPQKYWADDSRPYRYVTAQTIRSAFWESEASETQRLLLAAPPAADGPTAPSGSASGRRCGDSDEAYHQALTTEK